MMLNIVAFEEITLLAQIERRDQERNWGRIGLAAESKPKGQKLSFHSLLSGIRLQRQSPLAADDAMSPVSARWFRANPCEYLCNG